MAELRHVPPGRAGRRWLRERLAGARRAADLLDRKLRVLRAERDRLARLADQTAAHWASAYRQAELWMVRAELLGGERELALCALPGQARVSVDWAVLMGLRYPTGATCQPAERDAGAHTPGTAALVEAGTAYRRALAAAVTHAAAEAAHRAVTAEVAQTRRIQRSIARGRVPRLQDALRDLDARLEEAERAELVRLRWAAGHPTDPTQAVGP